MSEIPRTQFRNRTPLPSELDGLILVELAIRDQAELDEHRHPLPQRRKSIEFTGNVRQIALAEGWMIGIDEIDHAVRRLTSEHLIMTDRSPMHPGNEGCSARLSANGYARAVAIARDVLGSPLHDFITKDPAFIDIGQVQIDFLGDRFLIGCIEGEEDKAILYANQLEVDAGEVLKAMSAELDHTRAMLMAGILAHERITELELEQMKVPASDRIVNINHNSLDYIDATNALDHVIETTAASNSYRETDHDDYERRLAELEAGKRLLQSRTISIATVRAALWGTLSYLTLKFVDAPIGEAAALAWSALKKLFGVS